MRRGKDLACLSGLPKPLAKAGIPSRRMRAGTTGTLSPRRWSPKGCTHNSCNRRTEKPGLHLRRAGGTALGGLPPIPAEHRAPMGTRTNLAPLKLILFSGHPSLPHPILLQPSLPKRRAVLRFLKTGIRLFPGRNLEPSKCAGRRFWGRSHHLRALAKREPLSR